MRLQTVEPAVVAKIFTNGQLHVDGGVLEENADLFPNGGGKLAKTPPRHGNLPLLQSKNRGKDFEQGGFSAAVRPQNTKHPTFLHPETDIFEDAFPSVRVPDSLRLNCP